MTHSNFILKVLFLLNDLMATLEGNKRKSEEMNPKTVLRVVRTKVGHFIEAVGDDFAGFGYWKVSKNKSPKEEIFSEKKKAILRKKRERTRISPDSRERTTPESSQKSSPMHVSSIVSPRSPRFSKSTPVQRVYDSPPPKIQKEVISTGPPCEKVPSVVIPVKNATRKKKVTAKFAGFSPTLKWPPNSDYKLTDEETKLLDQFWDDYCKRYATTTSFL